MHRVVSADMLRTFSPPRELTRSRPRDVRLTGGGRALLAVAWLLGAAAIGVTIVMHIAARQQFEAAQQFAEQSNVTTAVVDRLWRTTGEGKPPFAAFHFDADGTRIDAQARLRLTAWKSLRIGDHLTIEYLPRDPRQFVIAGDRKDRIPLWLPYVIGTVLAIVALLLGEIVRRQKRLLMEGRPAPAVITAVRKHHGSHGAQHREMSYEFPLLGGGTATGRAQMRGRSADVGASICVVYDPDEPRRSHPYPFPLVRVDAEPLG